MKRIVAILIIITLLFGMTLLPSSAANDVCFIAVNETLLELSTQPYFFGYAYVPYAVFGNLSVYTTYFPSSNTVSIYKGDKQLYFNLQSGQVYDNDDNYYNISTIQQNGSAYVYVNFVCEFFGLEWSYIKGVGYGDVLRITDSSSYLSDDEFLTAATMLMKSRYETYINSITPSTPTLPEPSPSVSPDVEGNEDTEVYLSFEGVPSESILRTLDTTSIKAAFYLTPEEIAAEPDMVRRVLGTGHNVGILCGDEPAADFEAGASLLFDAACVRPTMISSSGNSDQCRDFAAENGLVFNTFDIDGAARNGTVPSAATITSQLAVRERDTRLRLDTTEATEQKLGFIINYLRIEKYDLRVECEV